ncbi:Cytospin-A [Merluccius polli]|uniref:Cytospin-A n=1 Tax=Merluccius polli TaxID=89951 RepID=A0AA47M7Y3_MERPO|nr:Cytospin-A [Merluccius polli]
MKKTARPAANKASGERGKVETAAGTGATKAGTKTSTSAALPKQPPVFHRFAFIFLIGYIMTSVVWMIHRLRATMTYLAALAGGGRCTQQCCDQGQEDASTGTSANSGGQQAKDISPAIRCAACQLLNSEHPLASSTPGALAKACGVFGVQGALARRGDRLRSCQGPRPTRCRRCQALPREMLALAKRSASQVLAEVGGRMSKSKSDGQLSDKVALENKVKDLLGLAKSKDVEILHLRGELRDMRVQLGLGGEEEEQGGGGGGSRGGRRGGEAPCVGNHGSGRREQNQAIRVELNLLKSENRMLKDRLNALGFSLEQRLDVSEKIARGRQRAERRRGTGTLTSSVEGSAPGSLGAWRLGGTSWNLRVSEVYQAVTSSDDALDAPSGVLSESVAGHGRLRRVAGGQQQHRQRGVGGVPDGAHPPDEENQHSTAGGAAGHAAGAVDLQQITQELNGENERLGEEKLILMDSLCQQERQAGAVWPQLGVPRALLLEQHNLSYTLEEDIKSGRYMELEQRYADLADNARFEREQLLGVPAAPLQHAEMAEQDNAEAQEVIGA